MKKFYLSLLLLFSTIGLIAQPYGNEWIRFSINQPFSLQPYFKIQVWEEGIHRLTFNEINQVLPANTFNPKNLQLFHAGKEQYIFVAGESDGVFNNTDYIEFYAQPNDGSFDTQLYNTPADQLNPYYSLFNDTAAYFLSINADTNAVNKRMILDIDSDFSAYTPADFVVKDVHTEYHGGGYWQGTADQSVDASYSTGEGFSGAEFSAQSFTLTQPTPNAYTGSNPAAPYPHVRTVLLGTNYGGFDRQWTISINGTVYGSYIYYGYVMNVLDTDLTNRITLSGGSANFGFTPATTLNSERNTIPYISVTYPHTLNFNGELSPFQKFTVKPTTSSTKTRLDISNFNTTNSSVRWLYVFSGDTIHKVNVDLNGSVYQTLVPTYNFDKQCILTTDDAFLTTGHKIAPVAASSTHSGLFTNYGYTPLLSSDFLLITHQSLMSEADNYKTYKSSINGGSYNVCMAEISELYDQFAKGINQHPQSIRNFCKMKLEVDLIKPKFLFLVGKSIRPEDVRRLGGSYYSLNLVPTYGNPPSDQIFTSKLVDNIFHPAIATGRLPARTPQEVGDYLNKVIEHDGWLNQQPEQPQEWMKKVLHFGGGRTAGEQSQIVNYLNGYKSIIEDTLFGGQVISFFKSSTDPIQNNLSQYLQNLIDTGVTIMTFFSHAAGSTFDITTDIPENYHNQGRYPLIIANSCYIGDIHTAVRQASENFVLLPNKGALGFIASPNVSYVPEQPPYTIPLYRSIASWNYGKSIGECMQQAIDSINPSSLSDQGRKSMAMGMTLNGDPSLKLYNFNKPDLQVTRPGVFFTPSNVTSELDSFAVNVEVKNLGRAINKLYTLEVTRKFPDGTNKIYNIQLNAMPFADTITFWVPMDIARASGLNRFDIVVDAGLSQIDESNESNNYVYEIPLLIRSADINPVYPFKYSIVPSPNIILKASTSNLFAPLTPYRFEMDTTNRFTNIINPFNNVVSSTGGIVEYTVPFTLQPNKVYYWRVANDAITPNDSVYQWKESSFIYIPGKTGWSQAHYSQFKEDTYRNIIYADSTLPADTTFKFVSIASTIVCHNTLIPGHPVDFFVDAELEDYGGCYNEIHLAVLDSVTLQPWNTQDHDLRDWNKFGAVYPGYGLSCDGGIGRPRPNNFFTYKLTGGYLDSLQWAINNIPNGYYILVYSLPTPQYSLWSTQLRDDFNTILGSDSITASTVPQDWQPFILFTKKGTPSSTQELYADSTRVDITLDTIIGGNWDKGYMSSVLIGPATKWTSLHWEQQPLETSPPIQDSISLSIIGIDSLGQENVLVDNLPPAIADTAINWISAQQYPYLKLKAYLQDELLKSPPQMNRWQIYYDEVPEAALAPNKFFQPVPLQDTLQEGDNISFQMAIQNISNISMDSMLVDFYLYDKNNNRVNISSPRYDSLRVGQWIKAGVSFNTRNYSGLNSLWIEANPRNDQPEQYHFNNLADITFQVNKDITNPILDVTFDGQHILDGDIVSAKPFIFIKVKDENKFIAMNDTSAFPVKITDPNGHTFRVYFETAPGISNDPAKLKWTPAALPDNSFKIEYNPVFEVDGIYQLEVQGSDEAGNLSGNYSYKISFEIINRSTITDFINYPNPFSNATKFVFTLTGSEVPTYMKIQIMTVTGKIVREITQDELGNIHIGRNITDYAWDGKDEFGDQLANGIYLYRVITQLNGEKVEHRQTDADRFFKKGYGKMYLLR